MQPPPTSNPVATVSISPSASDLVSIGEMVQLSASAQAMDGSAVSGKTFVWSSSNDAVATVSASGQVAAVANGTVTITASTDGVDGDATVEVSQEPAQLAFSAEPTKTEMNVPFASPVEVEVRDALGTRVPETALDITVAVDENGAGATLTGTTVQTTVDGRAVFDDLSVAVAGHDFTISASSGVLTPAESAPFDVLSGLPAVTVRFPSRGVTLSGIGTTFDVQLDADDANGDPTLPPATTWMSLNPDVVTTASFSPTIGRLTTERDGQVTLTADANGLVDDMLITVIVPGPADPVTWEWGDFNSNLMEDVWATSANDVWAVGHTGTVLHYDGMDWSDETPQLTGEDLLGVWASGPDDVWAVGRTGVVLHMNGGPWSAVSDGVLDDLHVLDDVWGSGPDDVWIAGATAFGDMALLHFDGAAWSNVGSSAPGPERYLSAVWGTGPDDVWAGGEAGAVIHFDGEDWSDNAPPSLVSPIRDIFGSGSDDVWVLVDSAAWHYDGDSWSDKSTGLAITSLQRLGAGWANGPGDAWLTQINAQSAWHFDGVSWSSVAMPWTINGAQAIQGTGPTDVWSISFSGEIAHYDGVAWSNQTARMTTATPFAVWGSTHDDIWAATGGRGMLHYDGTTWSEADNLTQHLRGMWGSAEDDVWAVGSSGAVVHYDGSSWTVVPHGLTTADLGDVWGSGPDDVWAVAADGTILRFDGTEWATVPVPTPVPELRGVWGHSDSDVWFVGANGSAGAVLHYDGTTFTDRSPPSSADALNDIWGTSPDDVWAVGDEYTLLHYDGTSWISAATGQLGYYQEIWGTGPEDIWVLGGVGGCCPRWELSLYHFDGTSWRDETPGSLTWRSMQGIWGSRSGPLWAWGGGGTLLRGTR